MSQSNHTIRSVQLKPPQPTACGEYDLDYVVVEYSESDDYLDFRLELGSGFSVYWALPAARNDRLRLLHVSGTAAYDLDEPELISDPFIF